MDEGHLEGVDKTYKQVWKRYKRFVDEEKGGPVLLAGNMHYLTRPFVDAFFMEVIPTLEIIPESVHRYRTALQWYANKLEWPNFPKKVR